MSAIQNCSAYSDAQKTFCLRYPSNYSCASAEVLALLLAGEKLTSNDTLRQCSTMRAAAIVNYLKTRYKWPIESIPMTVGCADGRIVTIACYQLPKHIIHSAIASGAERWCALVLQARMKLRKKAPAAYRRASNIECARKKPIQLGQGDLFQGA